MRRIDVEPESVGKPGSRQKEDSIMSIVIKIIPNDRGTPPSKLADAELHFAEGELDGLRLIGFSVWERRGGKGRIVFFPGRQYRIGDESRTYALLRPIANVSAQERVRDLILEAYAKYEHDVREASSR
jgi:hypothetical protein